MEDFLKICIEFRLKITFYTCYLGIISYNPSLHLFQAATYINNLQSSLASAIVI